jgi:MSHA biogenesis protein MshE
MSSDRQSVQLFLGELLVQKKLISPGQLERALMEQKIVNKRLGEVLLDTRVISRQQLQDVLKEQQTIREETDDSNASLQSSLQEIIDHVLSTRTISAVEQELLMSILLSEDSLRFDERQLIQQLFDKVQTGWIRVV